MAAVTINNTPVRHIFGDVTVRFYNISGATGSTLPTGMGSIQFVAQQPFTAAGTASLITGISVSGGVITFTSSAPMVNEVVMVVAETG